MRVTRAGSSTRDPEPDQSVHFYTGYVEMNELLNRFVKEARMDGIRVSIDAEALTKTSLGAGFLDIIQAALDTARADCIGQSSLTERYIKFRSMNAQKQSFIKILYSCEDPPLETVDFHRIRKLVEACGGYIKTDSTGGCGMIAIATPNT